MTVVSGAERRLTYNYPGKEESTELRRKSSGRCVTSFSAAEHLFNDAKLCCSLYVAFVQLQSCVAVPVKHLIGLIKSETANSEAGARIGRAGRRKKLGGYHGGHDFRQEDYRRPHQGMTA